MLMAAAGLLKRGIWMALLQSVVTKMLKHHVITDDKRVGG